MKRNNKTTNKVVTNQNISKFIHLVIELWPELCHRIWLMVLKLEGKCIWLLNGNAMEIRKVHSRGQFSVNIVFDQNCIRFLLLW